MKRLPTRWEVTEERLALFTGRVYKDRPRSVVELLERTVANHPDKTSFVAGDRRISYKELGEISDRIAAGFRKHGVEKGDRVAILLGVQVEFPLAFFAAMKIGALAVPLNTRFKGNELAYEINHSQSKILVVNEEYWPQIASVRNELTTIEALIFVGNNVPYGTIALSTLADQDNDLPAGAPLSDSDDALIMYTSGTTGKPKGAILHNLGLIHTTMDVVSFLSLSPTDTILCCVPLFHITGLNMIMLSSVFAGAACVLVRTFKVEDVLKTMASEHVTDYIGVINVVWLLVNSPNFEHYDLGSLKRALFGGSFAAEEMLRGIKAKLPQLQFSVGYGLTEAHANTVLTPFDEAERKSKSVGRVHQLDSVSIVDDQNNCLAPGGIGEVLIKSPKVFTGYWKDPKATKATITSDGWLHTGDIGTLDDEDFLYILDRKKDMINRGGEKIFSLEVENVISSNAKVLEVAVVGVPDAVMGEVVKATIVLRPGQSATEDELRQYCAERLADYKVPKYVQFLPSLPRNPSGKVLKGELRREHDR